MWTTASFAGGLPAFACYHTAGSIKSRSFPLFPMLCHRKTLTCISVALCIGPSAAFTAFTALNRHQHFAFTHFHGTVVSRRAITASDKAEDPAEEVSDSTILKVIDEQHYTETTASCTYLPRETALDDSNVAATPNLTYQSPRQPVLSSDAVNALRSVAQRYFDANGQTIGQQLASLESVFSSLTNQTDLQSALNSEVGTALTQQIYPLVRSAWANDTAFSFGNVDASDNEPLLSVSSAAIFATGGHTGAKVPLTPLGRDAGLFVVHIDLGNEAQPSELADQNAAKGGIYFESLVQKTGRITDTVVGPLKPGQVVVHKSDERAAAIITPSNIRELEQQDSKQTLDTLMRRQLLKTAESTRHYALRLILTTHRSPPSETTNNTTDGEDASYMTTPPAERSYRLRNLARINNGQYLTLACQLDSNHETHLMLGVDHLSRIDNPDNNADVEQKLDDINKAIFHLKKSAALYPSDPRVYFQLGMALRAKRECEMTLSNDVKTDKSNDDAVGQNNVKIVTALQKSTLYESVAVKLGINDVHDLTRSLSILAQTLCEIGDFETAISVLGQWAECGSIRSALAIEDVSISTTEETPSYKWLESKATGRNVALKTVGDTPLFDEKDRKLVVSAADQAFAQAKGEQLSPGRYVVHLDDLCASDPVLKTKIDHILQHKVYPLVRNAFADDIMSGEVPAGPLCVYKSIFVRYNGDEAVSAGHVGSMMELHHDYGIYSVNVALNSHIDEDETGFTGGGTFFEGFALDATSCIQRISPGHALLHRATSTHAGVPTTSGIRDILAIFLTARHPLDMIKAKTTYGIEMPLRLQVIAKELPRDKCIPCLEFARELDPYSSEGYYQLGFHLVHGESSDKSDNRWNEIRRGIDMLKIAIDLNPTDARVHFELAMSIATRHKYAMRTRRAHLLPSPDEAAETMIRAFETAIQLENAYGEADCNDGSVFKNSNKIIVAHRELADFMGILRKNPKAFDYLPQVEGAITAALQTIAKQLPRETLIPCLERARELDPNSSEMSYQLGFHLLHGDSSDESDKRWNEICRAFEILKMATNLNPIDARAHYELGMSITTFHKHAMRTGKANLVSPEDVAELSIRAFETAIQLDKVCDKKAGCKNRINIPAAYLALGDFMSTLRNYTKALDYLSRVEGAIAAANLHEDEAKSILEEAASITNFCNNELKKKEHDSSSSCEGSFTGFVIL